MHDLSDIYENRIKSLTKDQFDIVVKAYIRAKWQIQDVVFTDGSHDGGIDIRIVENEKRKRIPIQVTIDKNTYPKLEKDLAKIEKLIANHNYSDQFFFFFSGNAAESKLNKLEDIATGLGFTLRIIDAKEIGGIAENYIEIKNAINNFLNIKEGLIFSDNDKMQFDLLSNGSTTTELKERFAQSLIISTLYENKTQKTAELKESINKCFNLRDEVNFCERQIAKLQTKKIIISVGEEKNCFQLSDNERTILDNLKNDLDLEEKSFIDSIKKVLLKYKIDSKYKEVIEQILQFYKTNNSKDISEIVQRIEDNDYEIQAISKLRNFLSAHGVQKNNIDPVVKELFSVCSNNSLLQRISAGNLFAKLIENPLLIAYINQQPKPIYLDTPLLLHLLCVFYNPHANYDNIFYQVAKDFVRYMAKGEVKMKLLASKDYISEVAYQIEEAFLLLPFIEKDYYKAFGGNSNNVFLNFYKHLRDNDNLESDVSTFSDFMRDFGFQFNPHEEKPIEILIEDISYLLDTNGIEVITTPNYKIDYKTKDAYASLQKDMENLYSTLQLNRSSTTLKHDLNMLLYLFDKSNHTIDPTFVTWDNTFFEIRKSYHKTHSTAAFWHLFRPAKLIDHFSLLHFKINSQNIPHSVYSIIESDYDFKGKIKTLQDAVVRIIDLTTASGVKLSKELKKIRENDIFEINSKNSKSTKEEVTLLDSLPIDRIFIKISTYFFKNQSKFKIRDFKRIINSENTVDNVISLLKEELNYYKQNQEFSKDLLTSMDKIIETNSK